VRRRRKLGVSLANGVFDEIDDFFEMKFLHHLCSMVFDRPWADEKQVPYLFARTAFRYQLEYLPFSRGEDVGIQRSPSFSFTDLHEIVHELIREIGRNVGLPLAHPGDGSEEFPVCVFFEEIPHSAGGKGEVQILLVFVHGEDDYPNIRAYPLYFLHCLDPTEPWHRYIEDNHIRIHSAQQFNQFDSVIGLANDRKILTPFNDSPKPLANQDMIVSKNDSVAFYGSTS
jgi:hypothetical protein